MWQIAPYARPVSTEADESGADSGDRPAPPSPAQVAQGVIDLLGEVDEAFSSDKWAILDSGRQHATWLLYDGAALRHCCRLLNEIEVAAAAGLELSVRMLGRAHMEAWLVALYIHFGGYEALLRVAQDARHSLEGIELEARQFDEWLAAEKTAARKSGRKVAKTNGGIAQWNEKNPDAPPKPLLNEPYVPQLSSTGLDLNSLIEGSGPHQAQGLSVSEIVDILTKWGPEKGFSRESFRPIYLFRKIGRCGARASARKDRSRLRRARCPCSSRCPPRRDDGIRASCRLSSRSRSGRTGVRRPSGGHWSGSLAPSFVGTGAESGELAPDVPGFGLCAAEPSFEDCLLVRFLALPGRGGGEDRAEQRGQHGLPLGAVEVRQPLAPLLADLDARGRGAPFPPSGHEAGYRLCPRAGLGLRLEQPEGHGVGVPVSRRLALRAHVGRLRHGHGQQPTEPGPLSP
jgi:hypothetical protein